MAHKPHHYFPPGEFAREVGKRREERFIEAWKRMRKRPDKPVWFASVRKAIYVEDHYDHVDAYLVRIDGYEIPVQIKGTLKAARKHSRKWDPVKNSVIVVMIQAYDTDDEIIQETLVAIESLKRLQDREFGKRKERPAARESGPSRLERQLAAALAEDRAMA